jgi:pSer/pThr/pTyr-binding forkhead associated (FHA) protein
MSQRIIDQFLGACQAPARLELQATGADGKPAGQFNAAQPFALLGRDPANDLYLDDPQISQRHAYVQVIGGRLFCVDLGSRTGLSCTGVHGTSGWVDPGQILELGPYAIRYVNQGPNPTAPAPLGVNPLESRGVDPQLLPPFTLEFANGLTRQSRWRINRILTFAGRATGCKLQLADVTVSRYHCALLGTPQGLWIIDLLGKDGTRVNGERVRWAMVEDGDRIQMGKFLIRVWREGPAVGSNAAVVVSGPAPSQPSSRLPEGVVSADSPLAPLIGQFQRLQQRSFDEFHQTMLVVMQMCNVLHRDRLAPVRDDLDQVYKLTLELQGLHSSPGKPAESTPAGTPTPVPTPLHEGQPAGEVPAGVNQRITALQQERQNRWHKVLEAVASA